MTLQGEGFITTVALISAGASLAMGIIYLFLGLQQKNKSYLLFSLMGILLVIFFLSPPAGFILHDQPPYPHSLLWKRIFIFSYYGVLPWFLLAYTNYPKKALAYIISGIAVVCYVVMGLTTNPEGKPFWSIIAVVAFGCIFVLGVRAARWQYGHRQRNNATWLGIVIGIFGFLFLLTAINQFSDGSLAGWFKMKLFFPVHFNALFFMVVMGYRLVIDLLEKQNLEKNILAKETRWNSFMTNTPFIILELDREGRIIFVNDFGVKLLGHQQASELLNVNWFDMFLDKADQAYLKGLYQQTISGGVNAASLKWPARNREGKELFINWFNFPITDAQGRIQNIMCIGKDITEEEKTTRLVQRLKNELLKEQLSFSSPESITNTEIVGTSKAIIYTVQKALQVSATLAPVLLEGETGVGKELFANLIYSNSSRPDKPFIKVNCGALPKELIEDELFGHEKGAFTSAHQSRKGRFELANGGTIFLDEVGELPFDMQQKLLRVLQNGEFERVGGQKTIKVNVRILAATNRNLSFEIQQGRFRSDLYYRLNVFPITIPPLRNRKEDLPILINHFIAQQSNVYNKKFTEISHANMQRLVHYDWPGNIRELKNVIERSVIASEGPTLQLDWWDNERKEGYQETDESLQHIERDHILAIMQKCNWKINGENGAAEMLGMNPNTLRSKMKRLGIKRPGTEMEANSTQQSTLTE